MILRNEGMVRIALLVLVIVLLAERIESTFLRHSKSEGRKYYPWLTYVPLATYLFIVSIILFDGFFLKDVIDLRFSSFGLTLYGLGIFLRRSSQRALGDQWSIHIEAKPGHRIVRSGIYRYMRHPYSIAVASELLGFSLVFQSWVGILFISVVQLPLLLLRNRAEEKVLGERLLGRKLPEGTLLDIIKQFGLGKVFEFISINRAMKHYSRYYMLTSCITAVLNVGLFSEFQEKQSIDIRKFAKENKLDFDVLNTICGYLMSQGVLKKRGKTIRITRQGKFLSEKCSGLFNFVTAYQPVFDNLEDMLRGNKKYGRDLFRRGEYVAKATADLAKRFTFPIIESVISRYRFQSVLDLGCGSGEFLKSLADTDGIRLCGIDISEEAISYARNKLKTKRIRLEVCDLFDLEELKKLTIEQDQTPELITSIFVFHELAHKSFLPLIQYLSKLHEMFPTSHVLTYELFLHKWHKLRHISSAIREHHLFHYLSNQGLLSIGNWHNVFQDSGYHIEEQKVFKDFGQGYFLLHP